MSRADEETISAGMPTGMEVAVIGMACRFPGAADVGQFWRNLTAGVESITFFSRQELEAAGEDPALLALPNYVPAGRNVDGVELFDAAFFGYSPREAEIMDPQQRIFLETAWEALENAGHDAESYPGLVGVYAGARMSSYLMNVYKNPQAIAAVGEFQTQIANDKDYLATRVSYKLDLGGPSVTVQTACSTALVATHLACQGLLSGECDMALAGGAALRIPQLQGYLFREGDVGSPDGHCRAFDAAARGTIFGSGVGIVVLKRLEDALADGDTLYAVIKGSAINNDGSRKVGFTAPGAEGQTRVVRAAQVIAGVDAETITYVEAHGTGTPVGDPIEVAALTRAFRETTGRRGFCALGSVKTNIGHAGAAAGAAGLIKTALALKHAVIPPSLLFERPNPEIDFAASPFYVNTELAEWRPESPEGELPRRAGVSAFGIGGTNAHVILEEPPEVAPSGPSRPAQLLLLSARTPAALDAATARLAEYLAGAEAGATPLADITYTLRVGRRHLEQRRMVVVGEPAEAASAGIALADPSRLLTGAVRAKSPAVAFLFSGQGAQYVRMGAGLYAEEPAFRASLDRSAELLRGPLGHDLRELLFPAPGADEGAAARLQQTAVTQPALLALELALADLWLEWGVRPQAMLGHSVGEYAAACLAGVMTREEALALVAARGRLMQELPPGAMLMVSLTEAEARAELGPRLSLAAVNAPSRVVVSGPGADVEELAARLAARGVTCRRLHTSHAFHSAMMDPILKTFRAEVAKVRLQPPAIPYLSNVTGTWIAPEEATDPGYWVRHLRQPVRFADGLDELFRRPADVLLEVGPGKTLASLARQHPGRPAGLPVLSSLRHPQDQEPDLEHLLGALGQLWLAGVRPDWRAFDARERRLRVPLPTYPFERRRFWLETDGATLFDATAGMALRRKPDLADWFYLPSWKPSLAPLEPAAAAPDAASRWLIFADPGGLGERLAERLLAAGWEPAALALVEAGEGAFERLGGDLERLGGGPARYRFAPGRREAYEALLAELRETGGLPDAIAHLWGVTGAAPEGMEEESDPAPALDRGFYSLLHLAQALGRAGGERPARIVVVTDGLQRVVPGDRPQPAKAAVLGPVKVIPQEMPHLSCTSVDLSVGDDRDAADAIEQILAEVLRPVPLTGERTGEKAAETRDPHDAIVAWRSGERWVRGYDPVRLASPAGEPRLRERGVYLLTGGLGGFGLAFAEHLARTVQARLILVGRSAVPERAVWEEQLADHAAHADPPSNTADDPAAERLRRLLALEALGAEVMVASADVADEAAMRAVVVAGRRRFGPLHGVIHAAGVPGGGLIPLKTRDMAERVLAPKVRGTLALDAALRREQPDKPLDFLVLCSSTIAVFGGFGQVDYCAANSFLDAFAQARAARQGAGGGLTVAIEWSAWQEVGMAVYTAPPPSLAAVRAPVPDLPANLPPEPLAPSAPLHPLIDEQIPADPGAAGQAVFSTLVSAARHWVLDEHRILGTGTVPGTTWIELARAAHALEHGPGPVEIRDLLFLTPVMARDGESREVRIVLDAPQDGRHSFHITSRMPGAGEAWQEHARGAIERGAAAPAPRRDLDELRALCADRDVAIAGELKGDRKSEFVSWGPRWQSIRRVHAGADRALVELELPAAFAADLDAMEVHPALLDVATAVGSAAIGDSNYLPLSYRRVEVHGPLPAHVFSYLELKSRGGETLGFDVLLLDAEGTVRVAVSGFTMKRVGEARSRFQAAAPTAGVPSAPGLTAPAPARPAGLYAAGGMLPGEGVEVLRRVLSARRLAQIVVSPRDLHALVEQSRAAHRTRLVEEADRVLGRVGARQNAHPRPDIATPYVAPRDPVEARLAAIWQGTLGIEQVGVHDNFFDLGGDSVLGIQVVARSAEAGLQLAPEQLFEHQTIGELAAVLAAAGGGETPAAVLTEEEPEPGPSAADLSGEELDDVFAKLERLSS